MRLLIARSQAVSGVFVSSLVAAITAVSVLLLGSDGVDLALGSDGVAAAGIDTVS